MRVRRWAWMVAIALVLPSSLFAGGLGQSQGSQAVEDRETSPVTFYGHVFGHGLGEPMPANTLPPIGEANYAIGTLANCSEVDPVLVDCQEATWNKLALFSSPGPVQVEDREEFLGQGAYSQLHNERGQSQPIHLDRSESVTAGVYFAYAAHGWPVGWFNDEGTNCIHPHPENVPCAWPNWRWHPGAFEDVVMTATLYAAELGEHRANASDAPPIEQALEDGDAREIAHGQWGPNTVINGLPGYPHAIHAEIDLGPPSTDTIEEDEDFFLVFSSYQETAGNNYLFGTPLRWYSGEFFPPTFELPVENAITTERVIPSFAHEKLAIVSVVNMPWGSYDVRDEDITFEIRGPDGELVEPDPDTLERLPIDQSLAHGGHYAPVNKTVIWDYQADGAAPGTYEVTVEATNRQGTATHACTASFTLEETADRLEGTAEPGRCGPQTISGEALEGVVDDVEDEAGDGG